MDIDSLIHGLSTIIEVDFGAEETQGSGFFYFQLAPRDPAQKEGQWRKVESIWLITNRHVLLPKDQDDSEIQPKALTFRIRTTRNNTLSWESVTIPEPELLKRARVHQNPVIDICAIDIYSFMTKQEVPLAWQAVSSEHHAGRNKITMHVASDAVVIGYPMGFYDEVNLFPVLKSGIIASRWGSNFQGLPCFLIDAKLFPGSSGSIVISKPVDVVVENGQIFHAKEKQFALLGVYSGEYGTSQEGESFNVGIVWYGYLIDEIIESGTPLTNLSLIN